MKLENLANISEIFSSIAIVITLIVLVYEVQGNTATLQRQIDMERASRIDDIKDSPYIPGILAKIKEVEQDYIGSASIAFMERYSLTYEESTRILRHIRNQWRGYEADFINEAPGSEGRDRQIKFSLSRPEHALFWEHNITNFNAEFVEHVNGLN